MEPYFMRVFDGWQKVEKSLFEHFCGQNVVTKQVYNDKSLCLQKHRHRLLLTLFIYRLCPKYTGHTFHCYQPNLSRLAELAFFESWRIPLLPGTGLSDGSVWSPPAFGLLRRGQNFILRIHFLTTFANTTTETTKAAIVIANVIPCITTIRTI